MVFSINTETSTLCVPHPLSHPSNGLRKCRNDLSIPALEVLPGGGWDNLRNMDMGRVMNFSYSQCQTTEDGIYFIPDEVFVIPQKVTGVETNSEIIQSWLEQRSSTSFSINTDVSFLSVLNAKFSTENQRMKTHQLQGKSVTARVQVRNFLYTVKVQTDFTLDARFARQAEEIAEAIENNQTRQVAYLSEKMVLDYGTHVITSIDAGASLVQEDYLRSTYLSDNEGSKFSFSALAALNFFDKVKFDISTKDTKETSESHSYQSNITYSIIQSHGGAPFYPGITLQKWQESTKNNLVAIDRAGMPLHYFLNRNSFPDLPEPTVGKLALSVSQAIQRYYTVNTHPGCVNPESKNFNFQANIDDSSCEGPATNLSFGGVFQKCTKLTGDADPICQELDQKNPDTGSHSCRQPYRATLLRSERVEKSYSKYECHRRCHDCWLFFTCCDKVCGDAYHVRSARVETYWCSTNETTPAYSGYLFGGLYGPSLINPLTKTKSCPPNFIQMKLLSNGLIICLSNDYETTTRNSVPFGGLFSCQSNNPLAEDQPRCPPQFSQHLATVSDGCQVLYCVQSGLFRGGQLLPIHLPPFTLPPLISMAATNTVAVMVEGDRAWVKVGQTKMWKLAKATEIQGMVRMFDPASGQMTGGQKFGVAFGVICVVALVVGGAVVLVRRKRRVSGSVGGIGYEEIQGEGQSEEGVESQAEQVSETQGPTQPLLA
uniref:Macrophage-expressed gene 1 protein n=1 Tax=Esox lucius TaxID=8010 RepID=A0A3P9ABW1_ESOLU